MRTANLIKCSYVNNQSRQGFISGRSIW